MSVSMMLIDKVLFYIKR